MTAKPVLTIDNAEAFGIQRPPLVPEFHFLNDRERRAGETFLIYGSSKSGKTWLAGTAGSRTLFINNGDGISTLQSPLFQTQVGANPIVVDIREKIGARGIFDTATVFDAICDTIDFALEKYPDRFDSIVVDDATQLRRGAMNKGLEINLSTGKSKTMKDVQKFDIVIPAIQDYGVEMNLIEQFIAGYTTILKEAGKNFILNAHERITYQKGDKIGEVPTIYKIAPGFTGQTFPDNVPMYFDNVWHTEVVGGGGNRVYRVTTEGHEKMVAGSRAAGVFKTVEPNMNLLKAFERIHNSFKRG